MTRAVIYARYSSDNQREASINDHVRVCTAYAEKQGWRVTTTYTDHAISGASLLRPGYQKLLEDARQGHFDIVLAEALDRLSRDQEHIASLFKNLSFANTQLVTVAEGEIGELHVGLKGTMNALFLKDLALKTHRGFEGRVREGRSGGGLCYGYDVVRETDATGNPIRGKRSINIEEAEIVRAIFKDFANGISPTAIAKDLNARSLEGPRGKAWGPSTIYGNWRRGTGILNNDLYIGRLIWNRQHFVKDPASGKRQARPNPESQWIIEEVPNLRIVPEGLWDSVKERQKTVRRAVLSDTDKRGRSERAKRPVHLFSGLLTCGDCCGSYTLISGPKYGCSNRKTRGTCSNKLTIKRTELEETILTGLKDQLMEPALVKEFIRVYHEEISTVRASMDSRRIQLEKQLLRTEREIGELISAIKAGIRPATVQYELETLETGKVEIEEELKTEPPPPIRLHPNLSEVYRAKVENLRDALDSEDTRQEAAELFRGLIDEIRLVPDGETLRIHLKGELAEMLALSIEKQPGSIGNGLERTMVAGTRSHLYRTVLQI